MVIPPQSFTMDQSPNFWAPYPNFEASCCNGLNHFTTPPLTHHLPRSPWKLTTKRTRFLLTFLTKIKRHKKKLLNNAVFYLKKINVDDFTIFKYYLTYSLLTNYKKIFFSYAKHKQNTTLLIKKNKTLL